MRTSISYISVSLTAVAFVFLAGCSGEQATQSLSAPTALDQPLAISEAAHTRLLYASVEGANEVAIYRESAVNQAPIGTITAGLNQPWGLYVDKNGNLYVANLSNTVTVYPPGSTSPSVTYTEDMCHPLFTIVDQQSNVFVANGRGCGSSPATVVEYPPGSTTPSQVFSLPSTEVDGMDFDPQGNLYVAYRTTAKRSHGNIEEFAPGSTRGKLLRMRLHQPQALLVDKDGNILVVDTSGATKDIVVYAPGARRPDLHFKLPKGNIPNQIAITEKEHKLFASAYNTGTIYVTDYPLTAQSTWSEVERPGNYVQGVAVTNDQVF